MKLVVVAMWFFSSVLLFVVLPVSYVLFFGDPESPSLGGLAVLAWLRRLVSRRLYVSLSHGGQEVLAWL